MFFRFSGSDLDALCQAAQTAPAREFAQALREEAREAAAAASASARRAERATRREFEARRRGSGGDDGRKDMSEGGARHPLAFGSMMWHLSQLWHGKSWGGTTNSRGRDAVVAGESTVRNGDEAETRRRGERRGRGRAVLTQMRAITRADFELALQNVRPTGKMFLISRVFQYFQYVDNLKLRVLITLVGVSLIAHMIDTLLYLIWLGLT